MTYNFFAAISRMKYIERWALMRNARAETLSEHCLDVAMIAHVLAVMSKVRYGHDIDAEKAALVGLYHDASEIITGDMPTPVKYFNRDIRTAYKQIESMAEDRLISKLPDDLKPEYERIFKEKKNEDGSDDPEEKYMRRLVKAADKLSALIKCMEERQAGNSEFRTAEKTIRDSVYRMSEDMPEVKDFLEEFLPPYGSTLDELS